MRREEFEYIGTPGGVLLFRAVIVLILIGQALYWTAIGIINLFGWIL